VCSISTTVGNHYRSRGELVELYLEAVFDDLEIARMKKDSD
jgi:hypothetical protein